MKQDKFHKSKKNQISLLILLILSIHFISASLNVRAQANTIQAAYQIRAIIFKNDSTQLTDIVAFNSTLSEFPSSDTGYSINVFSYDGKVLFNRFIAVSFNLILDPTGIIKLNETAITVKVPYYTTARSIAIYHHDNKILGIDLSKKICNNNSICDLGENIFNCPNDCKAPQAEIPWLYIGIATTFVIVVFVVYIISKNYRIKV